MGTRCNIIVMNPAEPRALVELWKHYDGYPEFIIPLIREALRYALYDVRGGRHYHMLASPNLVAAWLIIYSYMEDEWRWMVTSGPDFREKYPFWPDLRPRGWILDAEYTYFLLLPEGELWPEEVEEAGELGFTVVVAEGDLDDEEVEKLKQKGVDFIFQDIKDRVKKVVDITLDIDRDVYKPKTIKELKEALATA